MAADGLSTSAEVGHDSPRGDSGADRVGGKRLAIWRNDAGPCLETAVGEQNIGGDDDRRGTRAFRDPVIGGIEAGPHHDPRDKRMDRYAHHHIADDGDAHLVAEGDFVHLFLRSEEHTSEIQSLMRISYAVFSFKKTANPKHYTY